MAVDRTTLIVIPARGGSQGIPRKCTKLLGGKPVLLYAIATAQSIPGVDVVVTTDSDEIEGIAKGAHALVVREPELLGGQPSGLRTLDPVISWATKVSEVKRGLPYQIVVTVQPTSPFVKRETVEAGLEAIRQGSDTATVVVDDRHLRWEGTPPKLSTPRIIRQQMAPAWRETAAVLATRREFVTPTSRFGPRVKLIEVSGAEAVDLDTPEDWAVAEQYISAPSARECLMARVLGERFPTEGLIVKLSAWDEETDDTTFRDATVERLTGRMIAPVGKNTHHEARLAIEVMARNADSYDILLLTSSYHQVRAFLTFVQVLQNNLLGRTVRLWNVPAASRMDKLADEWRKITEYQAKGHVASYEDGLRYLDWRDAQVPCATS